MIILKGGTIVNCDRKFKSDILIENDTIKQIAVNIIPTNSDTKVIDVSNKLMMPGGIDVLTDVAGLSTVSDEIVNETGAFIIGSTTSILSRVTKDQLEHIGNKQLKSLCNYGYIVLLNSTDESACSDMETCARNHGVNCFEVLIKDCKVSNNLIAILKKSRELHSILRFNYQEDPILQLIREESSDPSSCLLNTELELSHQLRHLSLMKIWPHACILPQILDGEVAQLLSQYKHKGYPIITETNTVALSADISIVDNLANSNIDLLSSANVKSHSLSRMKLLWEKGLSSGKLDECQLVSLMSSNPAKYFNMWPQRGHLTNESQADIVIWDPIKCQVDNVLLRGQILLNQNQQIIASCSMGQRLMLRGHSSLLDDKLATWQRYIATCNGNGLSSVMLATNLQIGAADASSSASDNASIDSSTATGKLPTNQISNNATNDTNGASFGNYKRPPTSHGVRNMQDSSFNFSGAQIDDNRPSKSSIRTNQPPGGKSSITF